MEKSAIWEQYQKLTPERQREVDDLIERLAVEEAQAEPAKPERKSLFDHPAVGMWKDHEDMRDSVEWVRRLRGHK